MQVYHTSSKTEIGITLNTNVKYYELAGWSGQFDDDGDTKSLTW